MSFKYLLFKVWLKLQHYVLFVLYFVLGKCGFLSVALTDFFHEINCTYVGLRPSEILYSRDVISPVVDESEGFKETILEVFRDALQRLASPEYLGRKVVVVKRADNRGPYYDSVTWNNPRKCPGWWVVEGHGYVWILKALEDLGIVKTVKVRCVTSLSEEMWNEVCSSKVIDGGHVVEIVGNSPQQLQVEKEERIKQWRTRLGICHSPTYHEEVSEDPDIGPNHRCQREFETPIRRKNPETTPFFFDLLPWGLYVRVFLFLLFMSVVSGCYLKGCGGLFGRNRSDSKTLLQ
ncbi:uncharacterized protein LOC100186250 isoform X2 [Ciona intestinalis]